MLSSVLGGARAIRVNIETMRAFVRPREIAAANAGQIAIVEGARA